MLVYSPAGGRFIAARLSRAEKGLKQAIAAGANVVDQCGGVDATATDTAAASATDAAAAATDAAATDSAAAAATATDSAAAAATDAANSADVSFLNLCKCLPMTDPCNALTGCSGMSFIAFRIS